MNLNNKKWLVDDRESFKCIRNSYSIVTIDAREFVGSIRCEEDAEYIVKIHNQYLDGLSENNELV